MKIQASKKLSSGPQTLSDDEWFESRVLDNSGRPDLLIKYRPDDYVMKFFVFEVRGILSDGSLVFGEDYQPPSEIVMPVYASGTLKWDGCLDLYFDEQDDCMLHFCGPETEPVLGRMMTALWRLGATAIQKNSISLAIQKNSL